MRTYWVYILASETRRLYIGSTSDLTRRLLEHTLGYRSRHAARYAKAKLVHHESTDDPRVAVQRERQLKGWLRNRKVALVERHNPDWRDLAADGPELRDIPTLPPRTQDPSLRSG